MTSHEISAKSLTIYFQNMMHDGIRLASNTTPKRILDSVGLVSIKALHFGILKTWDSLAHLLHVARTCSQVAKTASVGIWTRHMYVC